MAKRSGRAYLKAHAADNSASATPKLVAQGRTRDRPGTLVFMTEHQAALVKVIWRHFDGDAIAGQRLDPVLLHLAGRVSHDFVAGVELNPIARVRQDLGDDPFELDKFFLGHLFIYSKLPSSPRRELWQDRNLTMQESDGGKSVCSLPELPVLILPARHIDVAALPAFGGGMPRARRCAAAGRRRPSLWRKRSLVHRRNGHADQLLDVAQVGRLFAVAQRDRDACRSG